MRILLLVALLWLMQVGAALAWPATVMNIYDADTLTVAPSADEDCPLFVRLYGIDAPELGQNGGNDARRFLAELLPLKSQVEIIPVSCDAHGRVIAYLVRNGQVVNARLVREGHAWVEASCRAMVCRKWLGLQKEAQKDAKGLWHEKNPKAPWLFKQGETSLPMSGEQKRPEPLPRDPKKPPSGPSWIPLEAQP